MTLAVLAWPATSSAATVSVCVPGLLVSSRPPLWIEAPPSVAPVQLAMPTLDGAAELSPAPDWLSVKVPPGPARAAARSIVIDGRVPAVSGTDEKLTALLKL